MIFSPSKHFARGILIAWGHFKHFCLLLKVENIMFWLDTKIQLPITCRMNLNRNVICNKRQDTFYFLFNKKQCKYLFNMNIHSIKKIFNLVELNKSPYWFKLWYSRQDLLNKCVKTCKWLYKDDLKTITCLFFCFSSIKIYLIENAQKTYDLKNICSPKIIFT